MLVHGTNKLCGCLWLTLELQSPHPSTDILKDFGEKLIEFHPWSIKLANILSTSFHQYSSCIFFVSAKPWRLKFGKFFCLCRSKHILGTCLSLFWGRRIEHIKNSNLRKEIILCIRMSRYYCTPRLHFSVDLTARRQVILNGYPRTWANGFWSSETN